MADVFISYSRKDRDRVRQLADLFADQGWSVWWDPRIPPGKTYTEVIEQELAASRAVVVAWSTKSVSSQWVQNEARVGAERGVLVPIRLDQVKIPLEFSHLQTADLSEWKGGNAHLDITEVLARLKELAPLTMSGLESQGRPVPAQYNHRTQEGPHISYLDRLLHRLAEFGLSTRGRQHEHAGNKVRSNVRIWAMTGAAATITAIFALALINTPSRQLTIGSCDVKIGDTLAEYTVRQGLS